MSSFAIIPNYKKCQPNKVTVNNVETDLPAVDASKLVYPSKIFVQSLSTNTESIFIGPTGVLATGAGAVYELAVGSSLFLPSHVVATWKMVCASGGMSVLATYFEGVF